MRRVTRGPIDALLAAAMPDGLRLSPDADPRTLLLRLSFDLTGLPPSAEEIEAFRKDSSPASYEAAVERLLASPHFGERWARHWLDVAGYADNCNPSGTGAYIVDFSGGSVTLVEDDLAITLPQ